MARSLLTGERVTLTGSGFARHLKLEVQNGSGTWMNVGALLGVDYVVGGGWGEDMDVPVGTASFRIRRRNRSQSLSPLVVGSALNVDDGGFYSPLLEKGRAWRAWSATVANGTQPGSTDWRAGMEGRIDTVSWETDPIVIDCSDLGVWLADTQIMTEGVEYGTTPVGTPLATVLQAIINAWPSGKLTTAQKTVYVNTTNNFAVTQWAQGEAKVLEATRNLVQQTTADDFRFRYDAAHQFRLTLFDPQRGRTSVDWTFGPEEYYPITRLTSGIVDIRNVGALAYPGGTVTSPAVPTTDPSVLAYGTRGFRVPQSDAITTVLQAQTLLDIVVHDLNSGPLDQNVPMPMFWPVQLYDRITFTANSDHYDEDQTLMVAAYRHEFDGLGSATTTLRCGGKVVGAYADWLHAIRTRRTTIETYNQVLAKVTASDATTVTVTVTATSPAGTPTVQYVGVTGSAVKLSGPAVGVASASGTVWVFTRGTSGSGVGQAQFRAVFAGNVDDDDFVTIPEQSPVLAFAEVRCVVTASDATTETITVTGLPAGATVELVGVTGNTTKASGPNVGVASASGTVWVFNRGTAGGGGGQVQFRAVLSGYQSDDDFVPVPEQGNNALALAMRARVTATTPTSVTVRVAVADPNPPGTASVTVGYQDLGSGGVTPASGGTLTPAVTLTEAAGTYIDYTITRPAFGAGAGRVTFTATATGRMSDSDAVDVPEADRDTVYLASRARVTASDATTVTVRYAVADPYPQGANSVTVTFQAQGVPGVTPLSGGTLTPAATLTEASGTFINYTITRPAFGTGTGRVTFTATAANRVSDSDAVEVPANESSGPLLTVVQPAPAALTQEFVAQAQRGNLYATVHGTGASAPGLPSMTDGLEYLLASGGSAVTVTCDRAPFSTTAQPSIDFRSELFDANIHLQRTIPNQVKTSFGPSLDVNTVVSATAVSISYTATGTVELSIDGGTYSAAPASPISVTRDGSSHTYALRATLDGQTTSVPVAIPAISASASGFSSLTNVIASYPADTVTFGWAWSGPTATFDIYVREGSSGPFYYDGSTAAGATSYTFQSSYNLINTAGTNVDISFYAVAQVGGNVAGTSAQKKTSYVQGGPH